MTDAELKSNTGHCSRRRLVCVLVPFDMVSCAQRPMVHSSTMHWPSPDCNLVVETMSETANKTSAICLEHRTAHAAHNAQTGDKTYRLMLV